MVVFCFCVVGTVVDSVVVVFPVIMIKTSVLCKERKDMCMFMKLITNQILPKAHKAFSKNRVEDLYHVFYSQVPYNLLHFALCSHRSLGYV